MNARVFLLVLVCSVFMSVWNSDQQAMNAALAKKYRTQKPLAVATAPQHHARDEAIQTPLMHFDSAGSINVSTESDITAIVAAETTTVVLFFGQTVPTIMLPVPFSVEVGNQTLMSHSIPSQEIAESAMSISNVADEVVVTELVDDQTESSVAWESPEALDLLSDEVTAETLSSTNAADAADASVDSFAPSAEELAIVVESPQLIPTPAIETPVSNDQASSLTPQTSFAAALPLESTGPIIPLPKNLASGTWTVMNQSGDAFKVTIERTSSAIAASQETFEPNFCLRTTPDGDRWCFIRSFADHSSPNPTTAPRQATTEFFSPIRR